MGAARKKQLLARVLEIEEHVYGANHLEVAITRYNYATALHGLGEKKAAVSEMKRAVQAFRQGYGHSHSLTKKAEECLRAWKAR